MTNLIKKNAPEDTFRIMQEALNHGCSDGGCVIERTKGQHTNGGCKCLYHPDFMTLQRVGHMLLAAQDMADEIARLRAELAAAKADRVAADNDLVDRYRNPKSGVFKFPEDVAAIVRKMDETTAELAAAREQEAGAYLAAADTAYLWHDDDDAQELRETIREMTTSDATAALEARIQRERAEERAKVIGEAKELFDGWDDCPVQCSYAEMRTSRDALNTDESRKAGGE